MAANGSVQDIDVIPDNLKELYKTVWEIKQKAIIDMAADRARRDVELFGRAGKAAMPCRGFKGLERV